MKKMNNKGMSLVELIISMAITVILLGAISFLITTGIKNYQISENQITLQLEAQSIINEMLDRMREGNNILYDSTNQTITIYHLKDESTLSSMDPIEIIWLDSAKRNLYYFNDVTLNNRVTELGSLTADKNKWMGEYIKSMTVTLSDDSTKDQFRSNDTGGGKATIEVKLELERGGDTYTSVGKVKLRNRIINIPTT